MLPPRFFTLSGGEEITVEHSGGGGGGGAVPTGRSTSGRRYPGGRAPARPPFEPTAGRREPSEKGDGRHVAAVPTGTRERDSRRKKSGLGARQSKPPPSGDLLTLTPSTFSTPAGEVGSVDRSETGYGQGSPCCQARTTSGRGLGGQLLCLYPPPPTPAAAPPPSLTGRAVQAKQPSRARRLQASIFGCKSLQRHLLLIFHSVNLRRICIMGIDAKLLVTVHLHSSITEDSDFSLRDQ